MSSLGFKGIEKYVVHIRKISVRELRKVIMTAFRTIVTTSPVDTGRFRLNWNTAIGFVDTRTTEATQSTRLGAPPTGKELENASKGMKAKLGQTVYISNDLDYADRLENGYSKQAPSGVLHRSVREVESRLKR